MVTWDKIRFDNKCVYCYRPIPMENITLEPQKAHINPNWVHMHMEKEQEPVESDERKWIAEPWIILKIM